MVILYLRILIKTAPKYHKLYGTHVPYIKKVITTATTVQFPKSPASCVGVFIAP